MQSNPSREAFHKWMLFKNPKHKISDDGIMDRLFLECWQAGAQAGFQDGYQKGVAAYDEAVKLEREACAALCDEMKERRIIHATEAEAAVAEQCAEEIRDRSAP